MRRLQPTLAAIAMAPLLVASGLPSRATAGDISLTLVNVEVQGVKIWIPDSIAARKGDTVTLRLINKLDAEHGYEIEAVGLKEVVDAEKTKTVTFRAEKAGIFPIKCHLHPAHVTGQLVVLE
jgi:nitrosocyanin